MGTLRDYIETATVKELPQELRTRIGDHLDARAKYLEDSSTERHIELIHYDEETLTKVRSVADQHQAIVRRIAEEVRNPRSTIDDYRLFGGIFAATAVERQLSLRDAIDGLLFLKSEMLQDLAKEDFLLEMSGMQVKGLVDFIGTRIDVLFADLAVSYHHDFTEQLNEQLAYREKQNRQKDLFIRIASHEIRNPLTSAMILCELAAVGGGAQDMSASQTDERFVAIHESLRSIHRHLNHLLDMSLLEDDKLTLQKDKTEISELLKRITLSFEITTKNRAVTLTTPGPVHLEIDPNRVEQIVGNLLQNAAKYSPPAKSIELSLTQKDSEVLIAVTDHGNGIIAEDFERIFDPYARLAKDKDKVEGLGLGLYICRTLAHALGGTLTVESTLGSGSTFTLTLPTTP